MNGLIRSVVDVSVDRGGVFNRRAFLSTLGAGAAAGLAGLSFPDMMALHADEMRKKQMSCILLWMAGGPSQMETFDPKPDHANGGGTKSIATAVEGVRIAEGWNKTAAAMKDIAIIRSMSNREGNHERATYQLHTGYSPSGSVKHPGFGPVTCAEIGDPKFDLPHMVSVNGGTIGAGMLGVQYEPFVVNDPTKPPTNVIPPVPGDRFVRRLKLLNRLEKEGYVKAGGVDRVRDHASVYRQTTGMIMSPKLKAFDLEQEAPAIRDAYGRTPFGQGCLLARRLVETGVTFVEVRSNGWDTHQDNHSRVGKLAEAVDPGFATLVEDLKKRGLLERTLVLWIGEFGRTPKVNPSAGRDHFPKVFNAAIAGGGIKGGKVIGASSPDGTDVKEQPVAVNDLFRSMCHSLKIDPTKENISPQGRPIKIVDGGKVVKELFA